MSDRIYTNVEVAVICKVAIRSVNKWFDAKRLHGYWCFDANERRIPHQYLVAFLKRQGWEFIIDEIDRRLPETGSPEITQRSEADENDSLA